MIFFRLPFQENIFTTDKNTVASYICFHTFDGKKVLKFKGNLETIDLKKIIEQNLSSRNLLPSQKSSEISQADYLQKLDEAIRFIKENKLPKLVIARKKKIEFDEVSLTKTFANLCKSYPNAFVYLFKTEEECWMGAFSELLGKYSKKTSEFETMSLAGTLPVNEAWTPKEIAEQKPVTNYIANILRNYSENIYQSDTYDHISGNIKHLRTDFKVKISEKQLEDLIAELHPTPAVCGIPKVFCQDAIMKFENYSREFYAGYSRTETDDEIYFFVNLRCAKIYQNHAEIFVGGGITPESSPCKEWRETELKAMAILNNLAFIS